MSNDNITSFESGPAQTKWAAQSGWHIRSVMNIPQILDEERALLAKVSEKYPFRATDYYLGLIDWDNPNDPIRRIIIPNVNELDDWGDLDASDEASITQLHGVQHKYPDTALLLVIDTCASFCRYCFRKRLFIGENGEANPNLSRGLEYIKDHTEITNVLLTGGDPLMLPTKRISEILSRIEKYPHVKMVRIGSKMPAFNPWRLSGDEELQDCFRKFTKSGKRLYLMTHFDHPQELTEQAIREINTFIECGVICANQCPMIRGVNDDPFVLRELYKRLTWLGCAPYYLFQGRPTKGNAVYRVPIVETYDIFHEAIKDLSGLAKRARYVLSHSTGKIEVAGLDSDHIYTRYHRAKSPCDHERFMIFHRDDKAYWLDDLDEVNCCQEQDTFCANSLRYR